MCLNDALDTPNFIGPHTAAALQRHRVQPELGYVIVPLHMHVGWLRPVAQVEVEPVGTVPTGNPEFAAVLKVVRARGLWLRYRSYRRKGRIVRALPSTKPV